MAGRAKLDILIIFSSFFSLSLSLCSKSAGDDLVLMDFWASFFLVAEVSAYTDSKPSAGPGKANKRQGKRSK